MGYFRKGKSKTKPSFDIENMKIGSVDQAGHKIINVFAKYNNYIIYEIESDSYQSRIRTVIYSENGPEGRIYQERFSRVKESFIKAKEMLNHTDRYDENKHMVAHILSSYLFSDVAESKAGEKFDRLIDDIKKKNRDYLINKLLLLLPSIVLFCLLLFFHYYIFIQYVIAILIGNIISISFFYDSGKLQEFNHCIYYFVAGVFKTILSIILGFFVFIVISSEIVHFSFFDNEWGKLLLFIAVGFSERFVLKMISKTEKVLLDN